jgi:hypothetical protein
MKTKRTMVGGSMKRILFALGVVCLLVPTVQAITKKIPFNAKVYVAPMEGFETYIMAAIMKKEVPVQVVTDREKADYEIRGTSETEKAGWAKVIFTGQTKSNEQASITLVDIKSGEVVFAYAANKSSAFRGKQTAAESCAKHLKDFVEKPGK